MHDTLIGNIRTYLKENQEPERTAHSERVAELALSLARI